jgi:hypothetical protein
MAATSWSVAAVAEDKRTTNKNASERKTEYRGGRIMENQVEERG